MNRRQKQVVDKIESIRKNNPRLQNVLVDSWNMWGPAIPGIMMNLFCAMANNTYVKNLSCEVTESYGKEVFFAEMLIRNTTLETLSLQTNGLDIGSPFILEGFKQNSTLTSLSLTTYRSNQTGVRALCEVLKDNTKLKYLSFRSTREYANQDALQPIFESLATNTTLITLNVENWHLDVHQGCILAKSLTTNTTLMRLTITRCDVTPPGIFKIAKALRVNRTLTYLNLFSNTWSGVDIFNMYKTALEENHVISKVDIRTNIKYDPYSKTIARAAYRNRTLYSLLVEAWGKELYVGDKKEPFAKKQRTG